jgi:hypothetical protein
MTAEQQGLGILIALLAPVVMALIFALMPIWPDGDDE